MRSRCASPVAARRTAPLAAASLARESLLASHPGSHPAAPHTLSHAGARAESGEDGGDGDRLCRHEERGGDNDGLSRRSRQSRMSIRGGCAQRAPLLCGRIWTFGGGTRLQNEYHAHAGTDGRTCGPLI
eukprot:3561165-Prymnesium_polylepis.1